MRIGLEPQAEHIVFAEELARQRARVLGLDVHRVRMLVDQVADLVHIAFGEDPSLVDEQDVRRHRLDLVQDVTRHDDAAPARGPIPGST